MNLRNNKLSIYFHFPYFKCKIINIEYMVLQYYLYVSLHTVFSQCSTVMENRIFYILATRSMAGLTYVVLI